MSGVYIKGMELPKRCSECRFFAWSRGIGQHCAVAPNITFHATIDGFDVNYERNGDCPLVPVPDHGDLIDRKDVYGSILNGMVMTGYQSRALDCIAEYNVPTIIPADKEKNT